LGVIIIVRAAAGEGLLCLILFVAAVAQLNFCGAPALEVALAYFFAPPFTFITL
jgi:hypothetical protein